MAPTIADRLREERDRFVGFAFANADLLLELDGGSQVLWVGGAVKSILDVEADGLIGKPFTKILADKDSVLLAASLRGLGPGQRRRGLRLALQKTREEPDLQRTVEACIYRAFDKSDERFFLSIVRAQITAAQQGEVRQRDRVTGLLEAVEFTQAATDAVKLARQSGKTACLTLIEICGEAELKNMLGVERSEALLGEIGAQLKLHAIDHDSAGRVGDGKFSVTHLESESPDAIADAIAKAGESYNVDEKALKLHETTVRFHGNSLAEEDVDGILTYIVGKFTAEGTAGMENGTADQYLRKKTAEILTRVVSMRDLIHEQKINLHYQPIVSLMDRYQHHYEVLLRLPNGRSPFEDVKFAEEVNIVHELDLAVTNGAIRRIMEATAKKHHLSLAVNMSAKSLLNDSFITMFERVTERLGEDRKKLMVEVTESAKLEDLERASKAVDRLRARGHAVCLDDFGAGAASFQYLQALSVDFVKIDGAYVKRLGQSPRDDAMMKGIVHLCRDLGIRTIAEMVETQENASTLRSMGVEFGQGFLFGRPAPRPALPRDIRRVMRRGGVNETWV